MSSSFPELPPAHQVFTRGSSVKPYSPPADATRVTPSAPKTKPVAMWTNPELKAGEDRQLAAMEASPIELSKYDTESQRSQQVWGKFGSASDSLKTIKAAKKLRGSK